MALPPARILSVDVLRFETINEDSGFLNEISPADRNGWYAEARAALERGALQQRRARAGDGPRARALRRLRRAARLHADVRRGGRASDEAGPQREVEAREVEARAVEAREVEARDVDPRVLLALAGGNARARSKHAVAAHPGAPHTGAPAACGDSDEAALWWSPLAPAAGATIKLLAVGEESGAGELTAIDPAGQRRALTVARHPGLPGSLSAELTAPRAGAYRVTWTRGDRTLACQTLDVAAHPPKPETTVGKVVWPRNPAWDRRYENFFSAWIDVLFDAPPDASLDFRPLHQALRDPARNFLMNSLGLREDDPKNTAAIAATPDCADLPYFLRAYFAWKLGLPFGFRDCDRGTDARPPRCTGFFTQRGSAVGARRRWAPCGRSCA